MTCCCLGPWISHGSHTIHVIFFRVVFVFRLGPSCWSISYELPSGAQCFVTCCCLGPWISHGSHTIDSCEVLVFCFCVSTRAKLMEQHLRTTQRVTVFRDLLLPWTMGITWFAYDRFMCIFRIVFVFRLGLSCWQDH